MRFAPSVILIKFVLDIISRFFALFQKRLFEPVHIHRVGAELRLQAEAVPLVVKPVFAAAARHHAARVKLHARHIGIDRHFNARL